MRIPPILLALLVGCGPEKHLPSPMAQPPPLTAAEVLLIRDRPMDSPMALVENTSEPRDRFLHTAALPLDPLAQDLPYLVARMQATVDQQQGVGIAAPQVGVSRQVVLVQRQDQPDEPFQAIINPRITHFGQEHVLGWEGCLSVPAGFGQVERSLVIRVIYQDLLGQQHQEEISGWTARIFQHEVDHLAGVLFVDRLAEPGLLPKEEYREMRRQEREAETRTPAATPQR